MLRVGHRFAAAEEAVILDLETTGLSPQEDRIPSIAILQINLGRFCNQSGGEIRHLTATFHPGRRIPASASNINGIYDEDVRDSGPFSEDASAIMDFIGRRIIIGHNVQFDVSFLSNEFRRALGYNPIRDNPSLCTMAALQEVYGRRVSLDEACSIFGLPPRQGPHHEAMEDALKTLQVAAGIAKAYAAQRLPSNNMGEQIAPKSSIEIYVFVCVIIILFIFAAYLIL